MTRSADITRFTVHRKHWGRMGQVRSQGGPPRRCRRPRHLRRRAFRAGRASCSSATRNAGRVGNSCPGITDDVLGETLQVFTLIRQRAATAVHVKAGMFPAAQHAGASGREQVLFDQKRDDPGAEQLIQRLENQQTGQVDDRFEWAGFVMGARFKTRAMHQEPKWTADAGGGKTP